MPSTFDVKNELVRVPASQMGERMSELVTVLRFAGGLHAVFGRVTLEVELHTPAIVQRIRTHLAQLYGVNAAVRKLPTEQAKPGAPQFLLSVRNGETLARQLGLIDQRRRPIRGLPNRLTTGSPAELAAILRGAFLARGSLTPPGRSVNFEVNCPTAESALALVGAAARLGAPTKNRDIRGQHKVLTRDSTVIGELLGVMGAKRAHEQWKQLCLEREKRGAVNRLVNFDDANLRRSAQASVAACARVERAFEILGAEIPEHLRYAGQLRLMHREISLDELGAKAEPPMTKDAIAGRIRRLLSLADRVAGREGIPSTTTNLPDTFEQL